MPPRPRIALLAGEGWTTHAMYHALRNEFDIVAVIIERKPSALKMLRYRARKLGAWETLGQFAFIVYSRLLSHAAHARVESLMRQHGLSDAPIPDDTVTRVASANGKQTVRLLKKLAPQAVVVNGTRILSRKLLDEVDAPFINTHMGITPAYRGVHGGYWALANDDRAHCGVTVHLVDEGVDTGGILYQDRIDVEPEDNFATYPVLQLAKALPLMKAALLDAAERRLAPQAGIGPSRQWYHPTLWGYWKVRFKRGVK
ncbi:formyl transferase [Dyella sp. BiH032]|uniref:formyl transferase n=1 Tax=Dyella sp. BiH032 TaxID=3075430 RepID=UPI002892AEB2|nr:formyl transferase [Dyella sp. BiH032]WNL47093.1 formyl transferase [Dyella sp. BiH032]